MKTRRQYISKGFALPTVLIASVVMMTVLATAVASAAASRVSLQNQQYVQLARDAAESGVAMAKGCIAAGTVSWANPLRPGGTCSGSASQCGTTSCYVLRTTAMQTTFSVSTPTTVAGSTTVTVTGKIELRRTSSGDVWRTYNQVIQSQAVGGSSQVMQWKQVASGTSHTCGLTTTGLVYCWGLNNNGQLGDSTTTTRTSPTLINPGAITAGATILQITAGGTHTCAIASDYRAYCWGANGSGRLGDNTTVQKNAPVLVQQGSMPTNSIRQISAGLDYTCAVSADNKAYCWGSNTNSRLGDGGTSTRQTPWPVSAGANTGGLVQQVSAGGGHTCAVGADNKAYCWGLNTNGRLGDNSTSTRSTPVAVTVTPTSAMPTTVVQIMAAGNHTCAIASDNKAYCWGLNTNGQLGNNSASSSQLAVAVDLTNLPAGATIRQLVGGSAHTCAIASDNKEYCWGLNTNGQLGNGNTSPSQQLRPVAASVGAMGASDTVKFLAAGAAFGCLVSSTDTLYCHGLNSSNQLGDGSTTQRTSAVAVLTIADTATNPILSGPISGGGSHACSVAADVSLYCWGLNTNGQLGNNSTTQSATPVAITQGAMPADMGVRQAAGGQSHTCAIASDNKAYCWGLNTNGQLGDNSTTQSLTPVAVAQGAMPSGSMVVQVVTGTSFSCAIASDNKAYCWGLNSNGQLGNGSTTQSNLPVAVSQGALPAGLMVRQLTAGAAHVCAIASDNKTYCWGNNANGQLGNNSTTQATIPVAVSAPAAQVRVISAGNAHTCALGADSLMMCWGLNTNGQLGDGTLIQRLIPVSVLPGVVPAGNVGKDVNAGGTYTCATATNNKAYCWGDNTNGQLGDNSTVQKTSAVAVALGAMPASSTIQQIFSSNLFTCAVASDSKSYCWGLNGNNQLGDNTTTQRLTPVAVSNTPNYPVITGGLYFY